MKDTITPRNKRLATPGDRPHRLRRAAALACAAAVASLAFGLAGAACSGNPPPATGAADSVEAGETEPTVATGVNATVIVNKCPDASRVNIRTAQEAIQRLVGPCAKVPGGSAHFSAKLMPGGRIELASPEGDPTEGVVPTCVLKNRLVHRVLLKSPCTLDVTLDERTVVVDRPAADGGAGDAGGDSATP